MTHHQGRSAQPVRRIIARTLRDRLVGTDTPGGITPIPEGPAFTRDGELLFISAFPDPDGHKVFRFDLDTHEVTGVLGSDDIALASLVIHRDGRLFYADFRGSRTGAGRIAVSESDGTGYRTFIDEFEGSPIIPDDLIFAADGTMYYNDFQGTALNPTGRVIRVDPDGTQSLLVDGLAMPNGIALSTDESRLWVSEHLRNTLIGIQLDGRAVPETRVYGHFTGGLADSTTVDSADNVYQAFYDGGRVEVLDGEGNPLAVITPGDDPLREFPRTTHVAIEPGSTRGILVAGGRTGIGIFEFEALAPGLTPFSHR